MHSDTKTTTATNGEHPRNWRSYTVHGADHPLDEVERCVAILRVAADAAQQLAQDLRDEAHGRACSAANIESTLRTVADQLEDAVSGADHTGGA